MNIPDDVPLRGEIFEDYAVLTVDDLSRLCAVEPRAIVELVEIGVLHYIEPAPQWRFPGDALRRARTALRLQRDLDVNLPGVALALELMDELRQLRRVIAARHT